jgi:hypothetical protein
MNFPLLSEKNIVRTLIKNRRSIRVPIPMPMPITMPIPNSLHSSEKGILLKAKLFSMRYNEPVERKMAIILVYFNKQGSLRLINNLLFIKHMLDLANIPYFIGEMSINHSPFLFAESSNIFHFESPDNMFYKENIINLMEPLLPPIYDKFCIMDADIIFDNSDWYNLISSKLNDVNICQPFSTAYWLNITYDDVIRENYSYLKKRIGGHEGFVWGFQRAWFNTYKFPTGCFMGSGDTLFVKAVFEKQIFEQHEYLYDSLVKYITNLPSTISSDYLDMNVYHLYHGTINNRQYLSKHTKFNNLLTNLKITTSDELIENNADDIMQWMPNYRNLFNSFMEEYLINRNDDSI